MEDWPCSRRSGWPASGSGTRRSRTRSASTRRSRRSSKLPSVLNGGLDPSRRPSGAPRWASARPSNCTASSCASRTRAEPLEPGNLQFDLLGMYPVERARRKRMDEAEVKHGRIAMLAVVGYAAEEYFLGTPVAVHSSGFFEPFWAHFFHDHSCSRPLVFVCMCLPDPSVSC